MVVWVRLFGYLKKNGKKKREERDNLRIILSENSTLGDLIDQITITPKELVVVVNPGKEEKVLVLNGGEGWRSFKIKENDKVWIYPFYDGG